IQFSTSDTNENSGYQVRNEIAAFVDGKLPSADATIKGTKEQILKTVATGKLAEGVTVDGDKAKADTFLGLFDVITPNNVNLVLPPDAKLNPQG
ncbi:TPA: hypothetical protein MBF38_004794, partial [Klebsiella aerogenes]|nr:hypothetical protein [Klebsiella aerogenes]